MHRAVDAPGTVSLSPTPAESTSAPAAAGVIHPDTHVGAVSLTVSDLSPVATFYEQVLGLRSVAGDDGRILLRAADGPTLIELRGDSGAPVRDSRAPGLFHLAVLLPVARSSLQRWPDWRPTSGLWPEHRSPGERSSIPVRPDGNGIEIYRDRPRHEWPQRDGNLAMATLPLDLDDLLTELGDADRVEPRPSWHHVGHVHLKVSDLDKRRSSTSACWALGHGPRLPGALFVSAGGYHHHLGLNTWHSAGLPAPPGTAGLRSFRGRAADAEEARTVSWAASESPGLTSSARPAVSSSAIPSATAFCSARLSSADRRGPTPTAAGLAPTLCQQPRRLGPRRYANPRGDVAEWLRSEPAKPSTPVRFRSSPFDEALQIDGFGDAMGAPKGPKPKVSQSLPNAHARRRIFTTLPACPRRSTAPRAWPRRPDSGS